MKEEDVVSPGAYLLFYVRRDIIDKPVSVIYPRDLDRKPVDVSTLLKRNLTDRCTVM